ERAAAAARAGCPPVGRARGRPSGRAPPRGPEPSPPECVLLEPRGRRRFQGERTQQAIERCVGRPLAPAAFATLDVARKPPDPTRRQLPGKVRRDPAPCSLTSHERDSSFSTTGNRATCRVVHGWRETAAP